MKPNAIYCGDNLAVMQGFEDNSVDLFYGDPQFFTNKKYETFWGDAQELRMFEDVWVKQGDGRYSKDINVYLNFMEPRLREVKRVLKPNGSCFLHCDWHANAYLRVLCDQIFGYGKLVNEIIWKRTSHGKGNVNEPMKFGVSTDTILWYSKTNQYTFNINNVMVPLSEDEIVEKYPMSDERGRYASGPIVLSSGMAAPSPGLIYEYKGYTPSLGWRMVKEKLAEVDRQGDLIWTKNGNPRKKLRAENDAGRPMYNLWDDIERAGGSERLGYPTQKPKALLERIIKMCSNEGDLILDAWAGCGTTLDAAEGLGRRYVGVDISPTACRMVANRIGYPLAEIIGMAFTADEIAALTGTEFQNAVIRLLDPTLNTIKVNKKGADGGVDGWYFDLFISVKKYKAGRKDLDEFVACLYRNKQKEGMFIALDYSSGFTKEIARLGREQGITIYPFTLAQVVAGEHKAIITKENQQHGRQM